MAAPQLSSATPQSSTIIRAQFDQGMLNNAALLNPASYSVAPTSIGAAGVGVSGVTPEAVTNPTYVDLTVTEMTNGLGYQLTADGVSNAGSEIIDPAHKTAAFTGQGTLPTLLSIVPITATKLRFNFSEAMLKNAALSAVSNYLLMPVTPGAAPLFFDRVEVPALDFPTFVDIPCSEMTNGSNYQGGVVSPSMTDKANNPVNPSFSTVSFTGLGQAPTIKEVRAISQNRVDVVFTEPMDDNADIRNPAKYTWSNGLATLSVLDVLGDTVSLVTSDQTPNALYDLSVAP